MEQDKNYKCNFFLQGLSPKCESAIATLIAEILSEGLSTAQINVFANFILTIGDTMSYIASQKDLSIEFKEKCLDNQNKDCKPTEAKK